ncbi:homeobox-leucine zipper protein athb-52 [Phtheirospermum japonicum]|uniref:Homeobox-leucine zipper protein n=1 Tax=Phtheirospermum japonicum TaxID=374723 RepID=A0A830D029_9LAMI|nr:homeobox-leucine zipper protein athb-52 [Phtheirospermum japonicum]
MDQFQYPNTQKHHTTNHKKRLSQEQVRLLETNFNTNKKLEPDQKSQLAQELGVPDRQVAIWYQNKRAREKSQSLEADHKALQLRLDNVLADNARLKGEAERLKAELNKIEVGSSDLILRHDFGREFYDHGGAFMGTDGYDFFG